MKNLILLLAILLTLSTNIFAQGVGINTTGADADASAILDVSSTTQGFLPPRMTETQRLAIPSPATGLIVFQTDGTSGLFCYDGTFWNLLVGLPSLHIGDFYQGGIIFYLDFTGQHGLIAAQSDQGVNIEWDSQQFGHRTTGATGDGIGAGAANTALIVAVEGEGNYAAQLCNDLTLGGFFDWYLPAKFELNLMYEQRTIIGGFASTRYWSSNEYSTIMAWQQNFSDGIQLWSDKDLNYRVRAIRQF